MLAATAATSTTRLEPQSVQASTGDPAHPATIQLDPEGGQSAAARIYLAPGAHGSVTLKNGGPSAAVEVQTTEAFGSQVLMARVTGLGGAPATLEVAVDRASEVGATTWVEGAGVAASATVRPATSGGALVEVGLAGVTAAEQRRYRVTASYESPTGRRVMTLALRQGSTGPGGMKVFAATADVPAGTYVPIHVNVEGPRDRFLVADALIPDKSATLHPIRDDALVDTDDDGTADAVRLAVPVTASYADEYHLSVDLRSTGGTLITSAGGDAPLSVGENTLNVDVPLEALYGAGVDGPYQVTNALLTRGTDTRRKVTTAATLGATHPYRLAEGIPTNVMVARPTATPVDWDADGLNDELHFRATATVPAEGAYALEAVLVGPSGRVVGEFSDIQTLVSGGNDVTAAFPSTVVMAHGSGNYQLASLSVASLDDPGLAGHSLPSTVTLKADQWAGARPSIGRLIELWDGAHDRGGVANLGLYTSERERLQRVSAALTDGRREAAGTELARFVDQVAGARDDQIDATSRSAVVGYAMRLYFELPFAF
jgi:hypothetical protein